MFIIWKKKKQKKNSWRWWDLGGFSLMRCGSLFARQRDPKNFVHFDDKSSDFLHFKNRQGCRKIFATLCCWVGMIRWWFELVLEWKSNGPGRVWLAMADGRRSERVVFLLFTCPLICSCYWADIIMRLTSKDRKFCPEDVGVLQKFWRWRIRILRGWNEGDRPQRGELVVQNTHYRRGNVRIPLMFLHEPIEKMSAVTMQ